MVYIWGCLDSLQMMRSSSFQLTNETEGLYNASCVYMETFLCSGCHRIVAFLLYNRPSIHFHTSLARLCAIPQPSYPRVDRALNFARVSALHLVSTGSRGLVAFSSERQQ